MTNNPIIIPLQDANTGDVIEHEGQSFTVDQYYSQGKDMKDKDYTHIMFNAKGAFGLRVVE